MLIKNIKQLGHSYAPALKFLKLPLETTFTTPEAAKFLISQKID